MQLVIDLITPLFLLLFLGFVSHWRGWASDVIADGVARFLHSFAIPALLFGLVVRADQGQIADDAIGFLLLYFSGALTVWLLVSLISYQIHRNSLASIINGESAAFSNTIMLGLPIIFAVVPSDQQMAIPVLVSVHLPIMSLIALTSAEYSIQGSNISWARVLTRTLNRLWRNPIIGAITLGLIVSALPVSVPDALFVSLDLLKDTVVGAGLTVLGMNVHRHMNHRARSRFQTVEVLITVSVAKLIVMPSLIYWLGMHVFDLPHYWIMCAVIFASCPSGITPWLHANAYGSEIGTTSSAIAITTVIALFTIPVVLLVLGTH